MPSNISNAKIFYKLSFKSTHTSSFQVALPWWGYASETMEEPDTNALLIVHVPFVWHMVQVSGAPDKQGLFGEGICPRPISTEEVKPVTLFLLFNQG